MRADRMLAVGRGGIFSAGSPDQVLTGETLRTLYEIDVQMADVKLRRDRWHVRVRVPIQIPTGEERETETE